MPALRHTPASVLTATFLAACSSTPDDGDFLTHYRHAAELARPEYDALQARHASGELTADQFRAETALLDKEVERRANASLLRLHTLENQVDTRTSATPQVFRERAGVSGSVGQDEDF